MRQRGFHVILEKTRGRVSYDFRIATYRAAGPEGGQSIEPTDSVHVRLEAMAPCWAGK